MMFIAGLAVYVASLAIGIWAWVALERWLARRWREQDEHYLEYGE